MKIFLASTSLEEIRWATTCGLADGAFVTSDALDGDILGATPTSRALDIARLQPGPVFVAHAARDADELYRESRDGARASDQLVFDFPFGLDSVEAMRRAVDDGARVGASSVLTAAQALLAAKAGAESVLLHLQVLESRGTDVGTFLRDVRAIFETQRVECDIVVLFPETAAQLTMCARVGVDAVVMRAVTLRTLLAPTRGDGAGEPLAAAGARGGSFR